MSSESQVVLEGGMDNQKYSGWDGLEVKEYQSLCRMLEECQHAVKKYGPSAKIAIRKPVEVTVKSLADHGNICVLEGFASLVMADATQRIVQLVESKARREFHYYNSELSRLRVKMGDVKELIEAADGLKNSVGTYWNSRGNKKIENADAMISALNRYAGEKQIYLQRLTPTPDLKP